MKGILLLKLSIFGAFCLCSVRGNEVALIPGTSGTWIAEWNGAANRTDFVQWSLDLKDWHFFPLVEYGTGLKSYGFSSSSDKFFFRLKSVTEVYGNPETSDYDYDGISNIDEVSLYDTDPLKGDTDDDGLPDLWEVENNLDPRDNGSINPANGADGDPDGDGVVNQMEYWYYSAPQNSDTDGDGLNDYDEIFVYHSNPASQDSDWDGLSDYDEIMVHGTNSYSPDTDEDDLDDGSEINVYGSNPLKFDSDGDWMPDAWEVDNGFDPADALDGMDDADSDGLANQLEYVFMDKGYDPFVFNSSTSFPWNEDPDFDGLTTVQEFNTCHTNPRQPDTDGDGMDDGWEIQFGFSPLIDNDTDGDPDNDEGVDPDGDGITNGEESAYATNPNDPDTDGDGVSDSDEVNQGSNPNDPNDKTAPPNGTAPVNITFGDHSGSHSEKYRVKLTPLEGDTQVRFRTNRKYGGVQTDTLRLPKGSKYNVTLEHVSTDPKYTWEPKPDYDYTLEIPQLSSGTIRIIKDPEGIMGYHDESEEFFASGKTAELFVMDFKTTTFSPVPADRARKTVGVREQVAIEVKPQDAGNITWSLENHLDAFLNQDTGYVIEFTADRRAKMPTLRATFATGETHAIVWNVLEPTEETAIKISDMSWPAGHQGAGLNLLITTQPTNVSFYNVYVREIDAGTFNVTGYFTMATAEELQHHPHPDWIKLDNNNQWKDEAWFEGWGNPSTWRNGTYSWNIDVHWRTTDEDGEGIKFATRVQTHTLIDETGASREYKMGQTATRTP